MTSNPEIINLNSIIYCDLIDKINVIKKQLLTFHKSEIKELKNTIDDLIIFLENNTIINITGEILNNDTNWVFDYDMYNIDGTKIFSYMMNYDIFSPYKSNNLNRMSVFELNDFSYVEIRRDQYEDVVTYIPADNNSESFTKYIAHTDY
jgi:hypothetical protein